MGTVGTHKKLHARIRQETNPCERLALIMVFSSFFYQKLYPKHPHLIPLKQHLYPCYTRTYTRNYVDFIAFIPYVVRFARSYARASGQETKPCKACTCLAVTLLDCYVCYVCVTF